jgi:predicted ATPase/DNA-binding CsgD family transcriptional regulator
VLPVSLSTFIDRADELADLSRRLGQSRLITLVGPGGVGKTRLAFELCRRSADDPARDAYFVDLAPIANPREIALAFAEALGLGEAVSPSGHDLVADGLLGRPVLLLVDNCEHLVDASARYIEQLLRLAEQLTVVATSREPLAVVGEQVWRVAPLPVAQRDWSGPVDELIQVPSVRLFIDRAQSVEPSFRVTPANASAVAEVCRQLDGLPLAIELAATRVPALSAAQIAARLGDQLNFLTATARTTAARHQTLRAALEWSYDLLDGTEQHLLDRLAVLTSRWSLEAAEAVSAGVDFDRTSVLDVLSQLVVKSLVVAEHEDDGGICYRQMESVRQFGTEHLRTRRELDLALQVHAACYASLVSEAASAWSRERQRAGVRALGEAYDNIRSALNWYLHQDAATGLRMADELGWFWRQRGQFSEARYWLCALLDAAPEAAARRTSALIQAGQFAYLEGAADVAEALLKSALELGQSRSNTADVARALTHLGRVANRLGMLDQARTYANDGVRTWRATRDPNGLTDGLISAGIVAAEQGDLDAAEQAYVEGIGCAATAGDDWSRALALRSLGHIKRVQGDLSQAERLFEQALAIWRELGDAWGIAWCLSGLGYVALDTGLYEVARDDFRQCLALRQPLGARGSLANSLESFASLASATGDAERALRLAGAVRQLRITMGERPPPAEAAAFDRTLDRARASLASRAAEAAMQRGAELSLSEALEYALERPSGSSIVLTARERDVAALLRQGFTNRQIANELVIGVRTVETHVEHVLQKLNLENRTQLLVLH